MQSTSVPSRDVIRQGCARWAFHNIGAQMCAVDTGRLHRPVSRTAVIDGVELHYSRDGFVCWASDWARIWDLPLRRVHGGPGTFGHVDFYVDVNR